MSAKKIGQLLMTLGKDNNTLKPYSTRVSRQFSKSPHQSEAKKALVMLASERSESLLVSMENSRPEYDDWDVKKWRLQTIARSLVPSNHATRKCSCWRIPNQKVQIWKNREDGHAHYRNLMTCKNVWVCPVCSSRITEQRAQELETMLDGTTYQTIMATFTMKHNRWDTLEENLKDISNAISSFKSGRDWQDLKHEWYIIGTVKALELTWSYDSGWHVHIHELWIIDRDAPLAEAQVSGLQQTMVNRWRTMLKKVGRVATKKHGLHLSPNAKALYLAKFGKVNDKQLDEWTLARELAKMPTKKGRGNKHYTPFQILELAENDRQFAAIFQEYVKAMKGKQQLRWSTGLRKLLMINQTEESFEDDQQGELMLTIPDEHWDAVVEEKMQGAVIKMARVGTSFDVTLLINICLYRVLARIEPAAHVKQQMRHKEWRGYNYEN